MKTTLILSTSQISEAAKCHHAWALAYRENLKKADAVTEVLDEGSFIHALLEIYYSLRSMNPQESMFTHGKAALELVDNNQVYLGYNISVDRFRFLGTRFMQYLARYSTSDFIPVFQNSKPAVEVGFSKILYEDHKSLFIVESRLDLIVEMSGEYLWIDHKTQGAANDLYKYTPQFLTYAWATGFRRGMINYVRTHQTYNDKYTLYRDLITFPEFIIDEWKQELLHLFIDIARVLETFGPNVDSEKFRRTRASCSGAFNKTPCMFTQVCETQSLEMRESIKKFAFIKSAERRSW